MSGPIYTADRKIWRDGSLSEGARLIPEETALALTYNGGTYAVMMGTPQNLRDFAIGFSLSEGIVQSADEIDSVDIVELDDGIELRMWLASSQAERISERRRQIAGPTGCGICGIDSIAQAVRPAALVAPDAVTLYVVAAFNGADGVKVAVAKLVDESCWSDSRGTFNSCYSAHQYLTR